MASNEHGQATAAARGTHHPASPPVPARFGSSIHGRGLTIGQALSWAAGLLVISTLIANTVRSGGNVPIDGRPSFAEPVTAETFGPTTVAPRAVSTIGSTAASSTGPATTVSNATVVATTVANASTAPSGPTTAAPTTAASTGSTVGTTTPTGTPALVDAPPGPSLPTGQPWPEAILDNGRLIARGTVPSAAAKDAIVATLGLLAGSDHIDSELVVDASAARALYVPVRLSAPLVFAATDGEMIAAEKAVLVLWGTFLHDHAAAEVLVVARGPKPLPQDQLNLATARVIAAAREIIGSGADARQIKSLVVGDSSVQTGRLEVSLKVPA